MEFESQITFWRGFGRIDLNFVEIYCLRAATDGYGGKREREYD